MFTEMSEAVAMVRTADSLAVPLGPGVPGGFLHALGELVDGRRLEYGVTTADAARDVKDEQRSRAMEDLSTNNESSAAGLSDC